MTHPHPIREQRIHVWMRLTHGKCYRAFIGDGRAFPIFFDGATFEEAEARAEAFRADVIAKHEAAFSARKVALEQAREARARKKGVMA